MPCVLQPVGRRVALRRGEKCIAHMIAGRRLDSAIDAHDGVPMGAPPGPRRQASSGASLITCTPPAQIDIHLSIGRPSLSGRMTHRARSGFMTTKVLLIGATGRTGQACADLLLKQ